MSKLSISINSIDGGCCSVLFFLFQASAFPVGLGQYESLQGFWCTRCQLAGALPEVPEGSFPSLLRLFIDMNDVDGTVPDSWESINLFAKVSLLYNAVHNSYQLSISKLILLISWRRIPHQLRLE